MAPREALECVDMLLRDVSQNDMPFGGKVLVLGGDFRQVLPVMPHCAREDIVGHSIKAHNLWIDGLVSVFLWLQTCVREETKSGANTCYALATGQNLSVKPLARLPSECLTGS